VIQGLPPLLESARVKLQLWDVPDDEIDELDRTGTPKKTLVLRSKMDGTVTLKNAFEGQRVTPDQDLLCAAATALFSVKRHLRMNEAVIESQSPWT
jgi:hypothetical protein